MIEKTSSEVQAVLRKPVEMLVMIPRTHKLTPLSRKIYNVLLHLSQRYLRDLEVMPPANFLFCAPISEITKSCGAELQNHKAIEYLTEMRRTEVVWDSPDSKTELRHVGFNLLSEVRITRKSDRANWVHWALPPSLYELLVDPNRWATIDLLVVSRLRSYAAIVLYEICTKYRDNPSHLTCRKEPYWWIELLSASPVPIDAKTGLKKIREWRKFKAEFVQSAILEINEESDLNISLLEVRANSRTVKTVQFTVNNKKAIKLIELAPSEPEVAPGIAEYANMLGISQPNIIRSMTKAHGSSAVKGALQSLEQRQKQTELPLIRSPSGYMSHLLDKSNVMLKNDQVARATSATSDALLPATTPSPVVHKHQELIEVKQVWLDNLYKEVLLEITKMSLEEKSSLLRRYSEHLASTGRLTPVITVRLSQPDWINRLIKHEIVRFHGLNTRGKGWNDPLVHLED